MDDIRARLGARIRTLRQSKGLTQEALAERADVDVSYVAKVEGGKRLPSLDALRRFSRALDVPLTSLVVVLDEAAEPQLAFKGALDELTAIASMCDHGQVELIAEFARMVKEKGLGRSGAPREPR